MAITQVSAIARGRALPLLAKVEQTKALDKDAEAELQSAVVAFKKTFA